jgi:hypothetical protein
VNLILNEEDDQVKEEMKLILNESPYLRINKNQGEFIDIHDLIDKEDISYH